MIKNLMVTTMSVIDGDGMQGGGHRVPDHSLLLWQVVVDGVYR